MKRLLKSLTVIVILLLATVAFSRAFFSDTETSSGNVLAAGAIDLLIDNESYYNGVFNQDTSWDLDNLTNQLFFNFDDVKPGDVGEDTISLHVDDNDAWACMDITLTDNLDNGCTEPELGEDTDCTVEPDSEGELAQNINFIFWADDGDNVLEQSENVFKQGSADTLFDGEKWILADSSESIWANSPAPLDGATTYYIAKAWCFGDLTQARLDQDNLGPESDRTPANSTGGVACDGSLLGNGTQTDIMHADVSFESVQSRNNPDFTCTPPPEIVECTDNTIQYASTSHQNNQGTRKNLTAILADRTDPTSMFGIPQTSGASSDVGFPAGSFFSLGFTGGNIVVGFAQPFYPNPSGADISVFEVTGGVYPDEGVKVETGPTSTGPWAVASPNPGLRDSGFEMADASAQFIRLTEASNIADFEDTADGYDVDAVKTFCRAVPAE